MHAYEGEFEYTYDDVFEGEDRRWYLTTYGLAFIQPRIKFTNLLLDYFFKLDKFVSFSLPYWSLHKDKYVFNIYKFGEIDYRYVTESWPNLFEHFSCWFLVFPCLIVDSFIFFVLEMLILFY